jgi:alkylation response protein AidB-like acyl-CoA dehydrogenase
MLLEELMTVSVDIGQCVMINTGAAELLADAPPHLRERYLPGLLAGKIFGGFGIADPGDGSQAAETDVRARREGDSLVIDGERVLISNGLYSDFVICAARFDRHACVHVVIDRNENGYEIRGAERIAEKVQPAAQLHFADVRVPLANRLIAGDSDRKDTIGAFERVRAHVGMLSVSLMRAAVEESLTYVKERKQFGKPIATHQLVAAKLAEMATLVDAARLMCFRVFALADAGERWDIEASMAKWFANETCVKVCRDAVQLHGTNGLGSARNVERLAREATAVPNPDGTTEIQKLIISRGLTGISAFL